MLTLCVLGLVSAALGTAPAHSTATLAGQVFFHSCSENATGFTDAELDTILKFPIVTVEKGQAFDEGEPPYAESKIVQQLKVIKQRKPSICTVMYLNSIRNWPFFEMSTVVNKDTSLLVRNSTDFIRIPADKSFNPPPEGLTVFNQANPRMQRLWMDTCLNATATGFVDGCFSDSSQNHDALWARVGLTPAQMTALDAGIVGVMSNLTTTLKQTTGGPLIGKLPGQQGVTSIQLETFLPANESIVALAQGVADGLMVQVRWPGNECNTPAMLDAVAAYLIGSGPDTYFGYGAWIAAGLEDVETRWCEEVFSKPVGDATSLAVLSNGVWTRSFTSGTTVKFDLSTNTGSIVWGSA